MVADKIVDEAFTRKSPKFLTDKDIYTLATSSSWIDSKFVDERMKYLRKWKDKKATAKLAYKALLQANEYARGTLRKLLASHPGLEEEVLYPAYKKALEISDSWIDKMLELRKEALGY